MKKLIILKRLPRALKLFWGAYRLNRYKLSVFKALLEAFKLTKQYKKVLAYKQLPSIFITSFKSNRYILSHKEAFKISKRYFLLSLVWN